MESDGKHGFLMLHLDIQFRSLSIAQKQGSTARPEDAPHQRINPYHKFS